MNDTVKTRDSSPKGIAAAYLYDMFGKNAWTRYVDETERKAVNKLWLQESQDSLQSQCILDLGMGPGRWSKYFLDMGFGQVTGLDINPAMVSYAGKTINEDRFRGVEGDMEELKFPTDTFDKTSLNGVEINPLFVLTANPLPTLGNLLTKFWIYLDDILFRILPKHVFTRSWVITAQKPSKIKKSVQKNSSISVTITVRGESPTIGLAILGFLRQTMFPREIIVVGDAQSLKHAKQQPS